MGIEANGTSGITSVVANGVTMDTVIANGVTVLEGYSEWEPIRPGYDLDDLKDQGLNTTWVAGTFNTNATYGMYWGNSDAQYKDLPIAVPSGATGVDITFTGFYNNPSSSRGELIISNSGNTVWLMSCIDNFTADASGQSLTINGTAEFSMQQINLVNETRSVSLNGETTKINVRMRGYSGTYSPRYISRLKFT